MVKIVSKKENTEKTWEINSIGVGRLLKGAVTGNIYLKISSGLVNLSKPDKEVISNDGADINGIVLPENTIIEYSYGE